MTEGFTNGPLQKLHVDLYIYADAVRLEVAAASPLSASRTSEGVCRLASQQNDLTSELCV